MPTRISGACNACRSKKQKCSGDKSGCAQCEAAGITCTWPEQRKRGPAKGYIEGLEHRLHDAESLLLQLLPHITTQQLQIATSALTNQDGNDSGRDSPDRRSTPPVLNKKTGIEYWENFPLTTVDGIRRWQQDCEVSSNSQTRSASSRPEVRAVSPAPQVLTPDGRHQKRRSLPSSSGSYPGPEVPPPLEGMFHVPSNRRTSSQGIPQRQQQKQKQEHMHMQMNQQRTPWQTQMMNMDPSQNDITQQQMFTNVGYINASGAWQQQTQPQQQPQHQQQAMQMDIDRQHHTTNPNRPIVTSFTQSHLFW